MSVLDLHAQLAGGDVLEAVFGFRGRVIVRLRSLGEIEVTPESALVTVDYLEARGDLKARALHRACWQAGIVSAAP